MFDIINHKLFKNEKLWGYQHAADLELFRPFR